MFRLKYETDESGRWLKHFLGRPIDNYVPVYDAFFAAYDLKRLIADDKYHRFQLKPKRERVCRFCGLSYGATKFKSAAHLIPSLLGNKNIFSDFECVTCNFKFSSYESHLAYFLGISLSLVSDFEKDRIRKLKNPAKDMIIRPGNLPTGDTSTKLVIESHSENKDHFPD